MQNEQQQRVAEAAQWDRAAASGKAKRDAEAASATESEAASKRRQAEQGLQP